MATGEPPPPTAPPPHFQLTLRQRMEAMGVICVAAASIYWLDSGLAFLAMALLAILGIAAYFAVRRQYNRAEAAIIFGIIVTLFLLLLPAIQGARDTPRWATCQNNMRNIALALQQYEAMNGSFPPAYIPAADGKPIHSWRVLLLPYLDQRQLYKQYLFDEPWDGPNNSKLQSIVVKLYSCPSDVYGPTASYVAVTGPQTIWPGAKSTKMSDIKDGTANTIILVEVHNSGIHWMEPRDLDMSQMPMAVNSPTGLSISSGHSGPFANIIFADGRPQRIPNNTPDKSLRAALTIAGSEKTPLPAVRAPR